MRPRMKLLSPPTDAAVGFRARLAERPWRVIDTGAARGEENMALDVALLEAAAREDGPPVLRFYRWDPAAVSLGRFHREDGVDLAYALSRGWDLVRRPSGGR